MVCADGPGHVPSTGEQVVHLVADGGCEGVHQFGSVGEHGGNELFSDVTKVRVRMVGVEFTGDD